MAILAFSIGSVRRIYRESSGILKMLNSNKMKLDTSGLDHCQLDGVS